MATFITFLLVISYTILAVHAQGTMRLTRDEPHPEDDFLLPKTAAECPLNTQTGKNVPQCSKYNAVFLVGCWCECGRRNVKHTFYEPNNSCIRVNDARQRAGCDLLFTDETVDGVLSFFPTPVVTQKAINVPANKTCSFYFEGKLHAQYLGCDGAWNDIPSQNVIDGLEVTPGWTASRLQIRSKVTQFVQNNTGRILRVAVQCRYNHSNVVINSTCAMFKVEGSKECPVPQQSPSRPSATLPPPTMEQINTTGATLSPRITTTEAPTSEVLTSEVTRSPGVETVQVTLPTAGGENTRPTQKVQADSGSRKASKKNTFIIAGAVAGGILLIALILLILWRCNNPKKRDHHRRLESSISRPISQMSRNSIPVYTDAARLTPIGNFNMRTSSMDNPTYRRASDGVILGPDFQDNYYLDRYPTSAPPRPPSGKRGSVNGQVNPALVEDIMTLNPLYEGQVVEHNDLDELNCSDFAVYPNQIVLEERKNPDEFNQVYDCPEEILKGKQMTSTPVPVYYVVDDVYPESISNTFRHGGHVRGSPDGHVYDQPETELGRGRSYVVMENPNAVAFSHGHVYDEPPHDDELLSTRRRSSPNHGILKVGSVSPNYQRYPSQSSYDDEHSQVI